MSEPRTHFVGGQWIAGDGPPFTSTNPATGEVNWEGCAAARVDIECAVASAHLEFELWGHTPLEDRLEVVEGVVRQYVRRTPDLVDAISRETGKPRWEARAEVEAMVAKEAISVEAYKERCEPRTRSTSGIRAAVRYRPHGVVAVLGPFNLPAHLPNGHILPAVLAGNTVIFKPSEQAPLVGQIMAEAWADVPGGLFNVLQGGGDTGAALACHPGVDGVFFTGSAGAGIAINRALAEHPEKILALELGGNNPLIVCPSRCDHRAAAYLTIQSAFITAGQRCSCARRLIVDESDQAAPFLGALIDMMSRIRVGFPGDDPEPFLGPVISAAAARGLLDAQAGLISRGAVPLVEMKLSPRSPALLSPGLIDVTAVQPRDDKEWFGPLLQLIRVPDFDAAIDEANATRYGLAAGLISDDRSFYLRFLSRIRAGVVNWNRPLTGASSKLPFGGVGLSGNHRPSAYFAADYCSYPVASLESDTPTIPAQGVMGIPMED